MSTIKTLKNDLITLTSEFARMSRKGNEVFNLFVEYNDEKWIVDESVGEYSDEFMSVVFNQIADYIEDNISIEDHKNSTTFTVPTVKAVIKNAVKIIERIEANALENDGALTM